MSKSLEWRHNKGDGVSNHRCPDCLINRLFRRRSKKTSKLGVIGLCEGNSPVTGDFHAQRASNADIVSIWWRHHDFFPLQSPGRRDIIECPLGGSYCMTTVRKRLTMPYATSQWTHGLCHAGAYHFHFNLTLLYIYSSLIFNERIENKLMIITNYRMVRC